MPVFMILLAFAALAWGQASQPLRLVNTIEFPEVQGRIDHLSVDLKGQRLFVSALGNNTVEGIDIKAGKRVKTISGLQEPQGVLYVPATGRLYVANAKDGSVRIFDGSSYAPLKTLDYSDDADNLFLTAGRSPPPARSILESNNLEHAEQLQQLTSLMERFGATKTELATGNLLKEMVGTWGLEPETSTVSI